MFLAPQLIPSALVMAAAEILPGEFLQLDQKSKNDFSAHPGSFCQWPD